MALLIVSLEEDTVYAGHKLFMEVDDISVLIVGDAQGILGRQLRPHPIHLLNITIIILRTLKIITHYICNLTTIVSKGKRFFCLF